MPATRSSARPRQNLRDNVDPCEICGIVISRKGDMSRHAKTHATDDADKLPCPLEGCEFRTLQKSNLVTHINRHKKEKPYSCTDSDCKFRTCDPASLLRHRKQLHGYIPRNQVGYKVKKSNKHVPISLIRGIDPDSAIVASQFSTFSSTEASTSAAASSSSQQLPLPQSPLPSPTPTTLPLFPPSHLPSGHQSHAYSFPTNSFGESEGPTPIASTSHHDFTPEGPSATVLSTTSYPVYADSQSYHHHHDSLLFAPPIEDYSDRPFTTAAAEPWAGSMPVVPAPSHVSENLEYQHPEPGEVVYNTISTGGPHELELNIPPPAPSPDHDTDPSWPGTDTSGRLIGPDGFPLPLDTQQPEPPSLLPYTTQVVDQYPIHVGPLNETHHYHLPIGGVHHNEYDYPTHYQLYSAPSPIAIVPNPVDYRYQPYPPPSLYGTPMYSSPHDVGAGLGYYDATSLDGNNLNYHGFNTVSPHVSGFANPFVAHWQDDVLLYTNLELAWN